MLDHSEGGPGPGSIERRSINPVKRKFTSRWLTAPSIEGDLPDWDLGGIWGVHTPIDKLVIGLIFLENA